MKKLFVLVISMLFYVLGCYAQNVNVNPGAGSYADLSSAFAAVNAGTHTGAVTIDIIGNTTEPAGGAILNASGVGAASYTAILIRPSGGAARSITGAATAGLPMIDFNGADNVTIDGLNAGGNSLSIENTTVSATSGTSTIRFIGGATANIITNCFLKGAGTMSVATNGAVVFFSTDAVTANGNDNNTISNCDIGPSGANLPTKAILSNGSTTTTAIGNSGITINNNDIHDYFGAAVTSAGIATNGGTNTWSITNNRFYQTSTRTWTTGALHNAMLIGSATATSGAQGFTITGNTVGYASNTQTGTYALTGSNGTFRAIVFNGISAGTVSNINNNTVAAVSVTGVTSSGTGSSSPFMAIYISNGVAISNNNSIGSQLANGSLVYTTTSASAADMLGIFNFSTDAWTANNNLIGGMTATNAGAGAANAYGIRLNTGSTVVSTVNGNTIGGTVANSIQSTSSATGAQVAGIFISTSIATVSNNTVRNLTNAGGTGTTTAASVVGIDFVSATPVNNAIQNTIFNLNNSNTSLATIVTGIQFTGAIGNVVERNFIHSLTSATTSTTAEVNGIRVGGGTTTYRNNMIAIGAGIANAIGSAASNGGLSGVNGINEALGTNSFFHNSIYIGGAPTAGVGASYAFNGVQTTNVRSFRDNIFFNARSNNGATGKNYAVKINGTVANPAGLTINNNLYFASGAGSVFGFFNSLDVSNIAAWRTAVGQDLGSYESNPQYNDPTNATPDLHLHPNNSTVAESNGADVGVLNDYDGQTRAGLTPVDIGADAGNFVGIDLAAPVITYTALPFTCNTGDRVLTATITDITGVPTSGALQPRIYYRKNAGAWFSSQGVLASGSATNGTWNFTIISADMGGLVTSDIVQYYVIAQDAATTPNVGSNPGVGLVATDVNTVTTAPTTPNNYNLASVLSGTYTVGAAGTYATINAAFNAYNNSCLGGPVVFSLIDATYITTSDTLRANPFASNVNTLTIRPAAASTTITGNLNGPAIVLLDADFITIDGSSAGASAGACSLGGNAAIRDLTIANINVGTSVGVISIATGVNGAQNNTVKNVNILGQDPTTSLIGIAVGGNTMGTVGADNDNVIIDNCSFRKTIFGIYNGGASGTNRNTGSKITRNDLSGTTTNRIRRVGILSFNNDGIEITYNSIGGIETNESADAVGIGLGNQGLDLTTTTSGEVVNALVANNKINGVASLSATGFSAAGITVAGGNAGANSIRNNMITGITAPSTSPDLVAGIYVVGATGSNTKLYFNSVSMTGDRGVVATQTPSYGIAITGTNPTVELKNNILYTTQIASGGGVNAKSYAIGMGSTSFTNLNSNYNLFWSTGANDGGFRTGSLDAAFGTDYATQALWAAATGNDANSLELLPVFNNDLNDLHLTAANCGLDGRGVPIAGITDDYDCNTRDTGAPDMGADEFTATLGTTLAVTVPGTTDNVSYNVSPTGTVFSNTNCGIVDGVLPNGGSPASGLITSKVTIDASVQTYASRAYLQRHFDITPVVNQTTATARVTLYALQSEFDNYNANNGAEPDLMTGPADNVGKSNLRITKYSGNGTAPGNYVPGLPTLIDPLDADIVWDATNSWWTISFNVSGFSGFYIHSGLGVLPVTISNIRGELTGATNTIYWTTLTESNNSRFIVERSTTGNDFTALGEQATKAINGNSNTALNYSFVDANPVQGKQYYRLQMVDNAGRATYSPIVTLRRGAIKMEIVDVRPNPTTGTVYFNILGSSSEVNIVVRDLNGKEVIRKGLVQNNNFNIDLSKQSSGIYVLEAIEIKTGEKTVFKIIKY